MLFILDFIRRWADEAGKVSPIMGRGHLNIKRFALFSRAGKNSCALLQNLRGAIQVSFRVGLHACLRSTSVGAFLFKKIIAKKGCQFFNGFSLVLINP
jgi:hypothetical protein